MHGRPAWCQASSHIWYVRLSPTSSTEEVPSASQTSTPRTRAATSPHRAVLAGRHSQFCQGRPPSSHARVCCGCARAKRERAKRSQRRLSSHAGRAAQCVCRQARLHTRPACAALQHTLETHCSHHAWRPLPASGSVGVAAPRRACMTGCANVADSCTKTAAGSPCAPHCRAGTPRARARSCRGSGSRRPPPRATRRGSSSCSSRSLAPSPRLPWPPTSTSAMALRHASTTGTPPAAGASTPAPTRGHAAGLARPRAATPCCDQSCGFKR